MKLSCRAAGKITGLDRRSDMPTPRPAALLLLVATAGCPATPLPHPHAGHDAGPRDVASADRAGDQADRADRAADATAAEVAPAPLEWLNLETCEGDGGFPVFWFGGPGCELLMPPRGTSRQGLHFVSTHAAETGDLTTHHHFDWSKQFSHVRFWARSETPGAEVIVSLTHILPRDSTFYGDARAGRAWQGKRVALGPTWQLHTVAFTDFAPLGPGTPVPTFGNGGTEIHFVLPGDRAYDLWLDDLQLRCPQGC